MDESQVNAQIDQVRADLQRHLAASARAPGGPHGVTGSRFAADD